MYFGIKFTDQLEYIKFMVKYLIDNEEFEKKITLITRYLNDTLKEEKKYVEELNNEIKKINIKKSEIDYEKKTFKELYDLNMTFKDFIKCGNIKEKNKLESSEKLLKRYNKRITKYEKILKDLKLMFERKDNDGIANIIKYKIIDNHMYNIPNRRKREDIIFPNILPLNTYDKGEEIYYGERIYEMSDDIEDNFKKYHGNIQCKLYQ